MISPGEDSVVVRNFGKRTVLSRTGKGAARRPRRGLGGGQASKRRVRRFARRAEGVRLLSPLSRRTPLVVGGSASGLASVVPGGWLAQKTRLPGAAVCASLFSTGGVLAAGVVEQLAPCAVGAACSGGAASIAWHVCIHRSSSGSDISCRARGEPSSWIRETSSRAGSESLGW